MTGIIIKFMQSQGYGFVQSDQDGVHYFFHLSMMTRLPKIGEAVKFEPSERSEKGPRCKTVEFVSI